MVPRLISAGRLSEWRSIALFTVMSPLASTAPKPVTESRKSTLPLMPSTQRAMVVGPSTVKRVDRAAAKPIRGSSSSVGLAICCRVSRAYTGFSPGG